MAQDKGTASKGAGGGPPGELDWPTDRLRQQLVARGFQDDWARETAVRLKVLQRTRDASGRNALSALCVNTTAAQPLLRTSRRGTVKKYVDRGHLEPFVLLRNENLDWPTDLSFLRADVEWLRMQQLVSPQFNRGPIPWEPPSEEEVQAWLARRSHQEVEALLAPGEGDGNRDKAAPSGSQE